MKFNLIPFALAITFLSGCTVTPLTFEQSLETPRATRNDIRDYESHMRLMVGLHYANAAKRSTLQPELEIPSDTNRDFQVPFAIWDFTNGNNFGSAMGFLDWFNSGMNGANHSRYYWTRGLGFAGHPNVHYFTFVDGDTKPTPAALTQTWERAHALFQSTFNADGQCVHYGFKEKQQHALTNPKNVPGLYADVLYRCPHPIVPGWTQKVYVTAWSNPFEGTSIIGTVQSQCVWKAERGEKYADNRRCGANQAKRHLSLIGSLPDNWMQLTTTPGEDPSRLEVRSLYLGEKRTIPAPEPTDDYVEFLAERPYKEE